MDIQTAQRILLEDAHAKSVEHDVSLRNALEIMRDLLARPDAGTFLQIPDELDVYRLAMAMLLASRMV